MTSTMVSLVLIMAATGQVAPSNRSGTIRADELKYQQESFKQWWGNDLVMKLDDLPVEGKVPDFRVPYSGHDYPDRAGGTMAALSKYDRAFNSGRDIATEFERRDVGAHKRGRGSDPGAPERRGLFARLAANRDRTPTWYGHCNGWTAAAIRHAEPKHSVTKNGVVFTPADIKGLLAEIYMYSNTEHLGGLDSAINPGTLHLVLGNWLGGGSYPLGMEAALGEVVINYPLYSYKSTVRKINDRQAEVKTWVVYTVNTPREYNEGPKLNKTMYFHYALNLNAEGAITGGEYYGDGSRIDMLWTPLKPVQGGTKGNERGNPHVNVKEVLALWRASVPEDTRKKWLNVDPTAEDAILPPEEEKTEPAKEEMKPLDNPAATEKTETKPEDKPVAAPKAEEKKEEKPAETPAPAATPAAPAPATAPAPALPAAEPAPATTPPATEPSAP